MKPTRVNIPDQLKSDLPQTRFGKVLSATPVVMAVVATMLAGLASSEMTKAQYVRSLGAQQQSKAGDQWSFFQAKRMRSAIQNNTADLLQTVSEVSRLDAKVFGQQIEQLSAPSMDAKQRVVSLLQSDVGSQVLTSLSKGELPPYPAPPSLDPALKAALEAVENSAPDEEMRALLAKVDTKTIEDTLHQAREQTKGFDTATKPVNQAIDQIDALLRDAKMSRPSTDDSAAGLLTRSFTAARLRYGAVRYEIEARLNQLIANLYELQVRKSNFEAEHHHNRSQRFFFGMLAAQAGVIISTFAMAARNRNLLWSLAAGAGIIAIVFAIYVYLYI